ncbi:MAG TPA: F0F1 ATP synthase subunit A [Anaerolineae bacterium]|nr:F0F1 ATP synthase subunit A [Anaerolineae bacterium]
MESVFPRAMFTVLGIPLRDTIVSTWIMMVIIVGAAAIVGRRRPMALEMLVDFLIDTISGVMGRPAGPYLPFLGTLAIFIAVANLTGLLPGLKAPTTDINTPLALALIVFFSVHYYGIKRHGLRRHLKHYLEPIFLMLPIHLASEVARTISLTFRLFGNMMGEEIVVSILLLVLPLFVPVPMMIFGIFTGFIQAYVFTVLTITYLAGAVKAREGAT